MEEIKNTESIVTEIASNWKIIAAVISAVAAVLGGMWFMLRKAFNNGVNAKTLEDIVDKVNTLPCVERKDEIKETKRRLDSIDTSLKGIDRTLVLVQNWIMKTDTTMIDSFSINNQPAQKNSPKALNDLGFEILKTVDGVKFLEEHKDLFFKLIDELKPKTALDVEQFSYRVCFISTDDDIFNPLKNCIYNASAIKVKDRDGKDADYIIDLSNMCYVLSIPLRDMYLKEHPKLLEGITDTSTT